MWKSNVVLQWGVECDVCLFVQSKNRLFITFLGTMSGDIFSIYNPGTNILQQYVMEVVDFSSQYGNDSSISYTASNVIGKPTIFPKYGDYTQAFLMRTYGTWWLNNSSTPKSFIRSLPINEISSQDFIEIKFKEKVYPTQLNIYETFNPGAVIKIFAYSYSDAQWKLIWSDLPEIEESQSRNFCIKINNIGFPTDLYHLEFYHKHLKYYYQLDAILLVGKSLQFSFQHMLQTSSIYKKEDDVSDCISKINLDTKENEEVLVNGYFDLLPNEVFHTILSYLDLSSLCTAARVSRLFYKHCYDPVLYSELNLKPYWNKVTSDMLYRLQKRCISLQYLNLSWCGRQGKLNPETFIQFIEYSGKCLKYLYLSNCSFINNDCMKAVANFCSSLQELQMCSCRQRHLDQLGFMQISRLEALQHLDLYRSLIDKHSIIRIIRSCTKLMHLGLGSCSSINDFDDVIAETAVCLRNLRSIDLWRAKTLTAVGIHLLANHCYYLESVDIGWCFSIDANTGCLRELFHKCVRLKRVILTAIRTLSDNDLNSIATHLRNLEQLDVVGTREITKDGILRVLSHCKELQLLDVSFCGQLDFETVNEWKQTFPNVTIHKSFQMDE